MNPVGGFKTRRSGRALVIRLSLACVAAAAPPLATSAGAQWIQQGPTGGHVRELVVDPQTPSIVYAGTDRGVYRALTAAIPGSPSTTD
jgi:hypothetical protein